jgi:triosephosphate isomerase
MIAGNWKMYKDVKESIELTNDIKRAVYDIDNVDIVICPPAVDLTEVGDMLKDTNISSGAQNCYWEKEGAFTGEISVPMIISTGAGFVIIGHSERRKYFGETDETVNKRIKAALDGGLTPIVCVGETLEDREQGRTEEVVKTQVTGALRGFEEQYISSLIIAYEPVWAIGTGKTATPDQAQEVHSFIRSLVSDLYSGNYSNEMRILYGGSVKPGNVENLMEEEDIDGGLIGGASLKSESFADIISKTSALYSNKK